MKIKLIIIAIIIITFLVVYIYQPQNMFEVTPINPGEITNIHGVNIGTDKLSPDVMLELTFGNINWVRLDATNYTLQNMNFGYNYPYAGFRNIKILAILDYATMNYQSFTLSQWNSTVKYFAETYTNVSAWEIWNEPTTHFLGFQDGSPYHYYLMLKSAYEIIKSINPNYIVVGFGGLYYSDLSFAKAVISYGGLNYCDAISLHFYPQFGSIGGFTMYTQEYKYTINSYAQIIGNKPIWVTETGIMSSNVTDYAENLGNQTQYINTIIPLFKSFDITNIFWYDLYDSQFCIPPVAGPWGLMTYNGTLKPSYYAWKNAV